MARRLVIASAACGGATLLIAAVLGARAEMNEPAGADVASGYAIYLGSNLDTLPAVARSVGIPDDNVLAEPSFETGTSFATGINRDVTTIALDGAPHGDLVAEVTALQPGEFTIDDWEHGVVGTLPTADYRAQAWLAAPEDSEGLSARLLAREHRPDGTVVGTWESEPVELGPDFQEVHVEAVPTEYGNYLDLVVTATAEAAGQRLYIDAISLTEGMPVPEGFTADQQVFDDTFGGPGYDLTDHWNFGFTDKAASGRPWSVTGTDPYYGSGTRGWAPDCSKVLAPTEYSLPEQISQASTGSPYNAFAETGTGLQITAKPRLVNANGCQYTWVSGALNTFGREEFGGNGKTMFVQVRAKMPAAIVDGRRSANGSWGSIWTLPGKTNPESNEVEVDLMEAGYTLDGVDPLHVIASNLHTRTQTIYDSGVDLSVGYHTYGAQIDSATGEVRYFLDGQQYASYPDGGPTGPMYVLLNLHIVNNDLVVPWHSPVEVETPMDMKVSEVQVYER